MVCRLSSECITSVMNDKQASEWNIRYMGCLLSKRMRIEHVQMAFKAHTVLVRDLRALLDQGQEIETFYISFPSHPWIEVPLAVIDVFTIHMEPHYFPCILLTDIVFFKDIPALQAFTFLTKCLNEIYRLKFVSVPALARNISNILIFLKRTKSIEMFIIRVQVHTRIYFTDIMFNVFIYRIQNFNVWKLAHR